MPSLSIETLELIVKLQAHIRGWLVRRRTRKVTVHHPRSAVSLSITRRVTASLLKAERAVLSAEKAAALIVENMRARRQT